MHLKFVGLKRHLTAAEMSKTTPRLRGEFLNGGAPHRERRRRREPAFKGLIGSVGGHFLRLGSRGEASFGKGSENEV